MNVALLSSPIRFDLRKHYLDHQGQARSGITTKIHSLVRSPGFAGVRDNVTKMRALIGANSTGRKTIYEWTPELRAALDIIRAARPSPSNFLFCNRKGEGYINEETGESHGWDSMWQRFMDRVLKETKVEVRFTEHDLRAKCASDAETLDHARALLSHADVKTTDAIYRRKAERVKPLGGTN